MKLLVTGGSGFVGGHLVDAALAAGHEPVVLTRDPERAAGRVRARAIGAQLVDAADLARALATERPDVIVHAAAIVDDHDPRLRDVNVGGTDALLTAMADETPDARLVFISTFAVEDIPPTAYSESKLDAEALVHGASLEWVVLRPTLVYGPGDDHGNTGALVERMRAGTHWLPAGGRTRIQPVFVGDLARAILAAATADAARVAGHTYRLGGPEPISVRAWREAVREASGGAARIRALPLGLLHLLATPLAALGKRGPLGAVHFHLADHAVDSSDAARDLDHAPIAYAEGLRRTFGADAGS